MTQMVQPIGALLREWRQRRRLSQLALATEAEVSTRHLSFLETGRALPSRDMVLHLADRLDVPLRARNQLLVAAGYAPVFRERSIDDPELKAARATMEQVLAAHAPNPAIAIDRHWSLIAANRSVAPLLAGVDAALLKPPINVLRLSLHPGGLAPRIVNLAEWRAHLLQRLRQQIDVSADTVLVELLKELRSYSSPSSPGTAHVNGAAIAVPFRFRHGDRVLSFLSTTTVFGTPVDITLSELALESFFPADAETAETVKQL
ncbi:helix-turn-helix domain-containing protein [Dongia deserti]|uniref:helix-turn-helix domain-containing protein n=1 Tax=Dongia deserti TaxID=2268030 RepID=UPI000E65C047|nr:helix-turn-helix transcriptional regulator [Dongia deserti]